MNWNEQLQEIIDYVENRLQRDEEAIDCAKVAHMAGCSFAFFQKVFMYMHDISFSQYIRARKLTLAGYDLKSSDEKVVSIAYKYGYDSPTSFTKAFLKFHGVSPKEARKENVQLVVVPKMSVHQTKAYTWRIETKERFRLLGVKTTICCANNEHFQAIPAFWDKCQKTGVSYTLSQLDQAKNKGTFALFTQDAAKSDDLEYAIMVESKQPVTSAYEEIIIPAATWAVFDCVGTPPQSIQKGWRFLNEEWLGKYPFKHDHCPEIEWYSEGNVYDEQYLSQIWIPILKED